MITLACFSPTRGLDVCGGLVDWGRDPEGQWQGKCRRCQAWGLAAVGQRLRLDALEAAQAAEAPSGGA